MLPDRPDADLQAKGTHPEAPRLAYDLFNHLTCRTRASPPPHKYQHSLLCINPSHKQLRMRWVNYFEHKWVSFGECQSGTAV